MSNILAELLGKTENEISSLVKGLEGLAGFVSEDIRLVSDVRSMTDVRLRSLGLDPSDTVPRELQAALLDKAKKDNLTYSSAIGVNGHSGEKLRAVVARIANLSAGEGWFIKNSIARNLLRQKPPRRLMKRLGYRSVDSMLKREDIYELVAALPTAESARWLGGFWKSLSGLEPADFETRPVRFVNMPDRRWQGTAASAVTCMMPFGVVAAWPTPPLPMHALSLTALLFEAYETTKIYSSCLKLEQLEPRFGRKIVELMNPGLHSPVSLAGTPVKWSVLHRFLAQHSDILADYFDPHLRHEDLHKESISQKMTGLHPVFRWWADNDLCALAGRGSLVSMNLLDVAYSGFRRGLTSHGFRECLLGELLMRYLQHQGVREHAFAQLDNRLDGNQTGMVSIKTNSKSPVDLIQAEFA